ncbi:hypothetical protein [Actinokineospora inagensis]|uniref:hypothetical protein n=1 Tax=Actinokineospora inagensis TaxID=103730 RepID=UPI0004230EDF|nr:hypothetical protein [Actinokineospora inagensis]
MHSVIAWFGFFGAWLLVAGPVYQAALELNEQNLEQEEFESARADVERLPKVSPWWWLLPPVRYWLGRRRSERQRAMVMAALSPEQRGQLVWFIDTGAAWMFVGTGGLFLAVKETWELAENYEWPVGVFCGLVVVMAALCLVNAIRRMARSRSVIESGGQRHP